MLHLFLALNLVSATWLVKAPSANPQEFIVYSQNSDYQKISGYFLRCEENTQLLEDFKKAQILFLDGNLEKAKQQFLIIAEKKWSCDWGENERQIIAFSFLRIAQIEQDPSQQTRWLTEANQFDSEWTPDASVFPPPLVAQFAAIRKSAKPQKIVLPSFSQKFTALLRNGRFVSLAQLSFEAPSSKARYTFVSDTYQIETVFLTLSELENLIIQPQPLVFGDCDDFQLSENLKWVENVTVFHSLNCVKDSQKKEDGKPQTKIALSTQLPSMPESTSPAAKTWIQRNGIWLGTAILSSVLVTYYIKNQNREQTVAVPTTTIYQKPGGGE